MKKGFTLIELIVVIGIISIILAISKPSVIAYIRRDRIAISTDKLINDLKYAKMYAMSNDDSSIYIRFYKAFGSYEYDSYAICDGNRLTNNILKKVKLPDGVRICARGDGSTFDITEKITFQSAGNVSPFACTIALKDLDTGEKTYITLTIGFTRIMEIKK